MAKEKKQTQVINMSSDNMAKAAEFLGNLLVKEFEIKEATIKDDFCNYTFEVASGVGLGDTHNVKGKGIIKPEMRKAFAQLNVHLAMVDDIFKHSGIDFADINTMHNDPLATLYSVTGFKIKGGIENESIVLIGNKYVSSAAGRIELESPKILIESTSSYKWYNELKAAADAVRLEVEKYKNGNYIPVIVDEDEKDPKKTKQTKMTFLAPETEGDNGEESQSVEHSSGSNDDSEFENGKI